MNTTTTTSTKPTYEELEAEVKKLREESYPMWELTYVSRMLNVARNTLFVITGVNYGEEAVTKAKAALDHIKLIEKDWNEEYKARTK